MNIVQIVENLEVGGLERMAVDLGAAQVRAGHRASIYCVSQAGKLAPAAEAEGVSVVAFGKKPGFSARTVLELAARLRKDGAHVVHTHGSAIHHYGALAGWLAWTNAIVNTRHGLGTLHTGARQERHYRRSIGLTSALAFVCEDGRQHFVKKLNLPPAKCHVIVNGIDLRRFAGAQASPGANAPSVRFGTVGRLVSAKGHSILLEAFAMLRERYPHVSLSIVGYGELREQLEAQILRLRLSDCVTLEGLQANVPEILPHWDVFVLSSISEGLPLVVMEAMAVGLPVVSTKVGGVPEILPDGEAGYLCEIGDAGALCNAMYRAATSTTLREVGRRGRDLAFANYGVDLMQSQYEELYRQLVGT